MSRFCARDPTADGWDCDWQLHLTAQACQHLHTHTHTHKHPCTQASRARARPRARPRLHTHKDWYLHRQLAARSLLAPRTRTCTRICTCEHTCMLTRRLTSLLSVVTCSALTSSCTPSCHERSAGGVVRANTGVSQGVSQVSPDQGVGQDSLQGGSCGGVSEAIVQDSVCVRA